MIRLIRRGHQGTRLAPKYIGRYGEANGENIGVFQGSAIIALLFIIYLDGVTEDLAALNRRTKLPMGIIQDHPHERNKNTMGRSQKRRRGNI